MQPQQLDPQVVNLAKAIRQVESGGNFQAVGQSKEKGGYQYTPDTWNAAAAKYGVNVPLEQATPQQQNEVTYKRIKEWKDSGKNVGQIASMWNAGEGKPNAYQENWRGVNEYGVAYDTPAYAEKVAKAYQQIKGIPPTEYQTNIQMGEKEKPGAVTYGDEKKPDGLGTQLNERLVQMDTAIGKSMAGEQNPLSGVLQVGGAGAGAILDTTGAAVKSIPVVGDAVRGIENLLGKGAQAVLETPTGKELAENYFAWAEKNPELASNLSAVSNIASVIPIFGGVKTALSASRDAVDNAFKGSLEKAAKQEIEQTIARVRTGGQKLSSSSARGLDPVGTMIKDDALPDVVPDARGINRYNTAKAEQKLSDIVDGLDDQLDIVLGELSRDISGYVPLNTLKDSVVSELKKEFKGSPELNNLIKKVEDDFESIGTSYGDLVTLNELNSIKRQVRKSVNFDSPALDRSVRYHEGQTIMRVIEDVAKAKGLGDVRKINQDMAARLEAQEMLSKFINNKSVVDNPGMRGLVGRQGENVAVSAGEAVGQSFGTPLVGGLVGKAAFDATRRGGKSAVEKLSTRGRKRTSGGLVSRTALPATATLQGAYTGLQGQER